MSDSTSRSSPDTSVGHLSVHFEGDHPQDVPFLFEQPQKRLPGAFGFSALGHGAVILFIILFLRYAPSPQSATDVFQNQLKDIIWLAQAGPGGGGGGGGNRMPDPPRKMTALPKTVAELKLEVPKPTPVPVDDPKPPELVLPAKTLVESLPGAVDSIAAANSASQGPGSGGGYGTGSGTGIGPGLGPGLGPGSGGGSGGGVYQPGSGVSLPIKLKEVKPQYTADAMRAKIQGVVVLECVVMPDGTVGDIHVIRSLDPVFGLDQKAIEAARQWRFIPGTKGGQPVPVLISIEMEFTLR